MRQELKPKLLAFLGRCGCWELPIVAHACACPWTALRFRSFCRAICSGCNVFCIFLGGDERAATPAAGKMGPAAGTGVIAASATLPTFAVVDRDSSADTAAASGAGGPGIASSLIFSALRHTCICSTRLAASLWEYPLIFMALGISTPVAVFGSQAMKKMAAFLAQQST